MFALTKNMNLILWSEQLTQRENFLHWYHSFPYYYRSKQISHSPSRRIWWRLCSLKCLRMWKLPLLRTKRRGRRRHLRRSLPHPVHRQRPQLHRGMRMGPPQRGALRKRTGRTGERIRGRNAEGRSRRESRTRRSKYNKRSLSRVNRAWKTSDIYLSIIKLLTTIIYLCQPRLPYG